MQRIVIASLDGNSLILNQRLFALSVYGIRWVSNEKLMFQHVGYDAAVGLSGVIERDWRIIDITTQTQKVLIENEGWNNPLNPFELIDPLRNDPDHVVMSVEGKSTYSLYKVNINNGEYKQIAQGLARTFDWFTDKEGNPALRFDIGGNKASTIDVLAKDQSTGKWKIIKEIKRRKHDNVLRLDFYPYGFAENKNELVVLADEEDRERRIVATFDFEQQQK